MRNRSVPSIPCVEVDRCPCGNAETSFNHPHKPRSIPAPRLRSGACISRSSRAGPDARLRPNNPPLDRVGPQAPPTRGPTPAARRARRPARGSLPWTTRTSYRRCPWDNFTPPHRYMISPPLTQSGMRRTAAGRTSENSKSTVGATAIRRSGSSATSRRSTGRRACGWAP